MKVDFGKNYFDWYILISLDNGYKKKKKIRNPRYDSPTQ